MSGGRSAAAGRPPSFPALLGADGRRSRLVVRHRGEVILDERLGCEPDALFWTFSVSKLLATIAVERLAESGDVDLDAPIAEVWPEFGRAGKAAITAREVLRHRTGMPLAGSAFGDALAMTSWRRMTRRIAAARPELDPETGPAYQWLVYGYILGEWSARATGRTWERIVHEEVLDRLPDGGMLPRLGAADLPRAVPLRSPRSRIATRYLDSARVRTALIPSAGVSATASGLARFGQTLLDDWTTGSARLLRASTLDRMAVPTARGQRDQWAHEHVRWGEGVQLGGVRDDGSLGAMGGLTSPITLGHNGSGCALLWIDPELDLVCAVTTDLLTRAGSAWLAQVSDEVVRLVA